MCGIAGIISSNSSFVQQQQLQCMADVLIHRGPNGDGFWINMQQTVGFAHRRLAIIDLSNEAAQPMHFLHYTIIFNGEIYNYKELKEDLSGKGYVFKTASDTEVIPAAYDCWGIDFLDHFDGMFAFALWNEKEQNLLLARDRFGEKPLYYHADYTQRGRFAQFIFASEMKALWAVGVPKNLEGTSMLNYLTLGYTQNPIKKTATFYSNILSLPPGHYLTVTPNEGRVQMKRWYKFQTTISDGSISSDTYIETFRDLLLQSVERRLRSDVSIGTSLSGGLDSSSIIAAIAGVKDLNKHWENIGFTAAFPGFEKDELVFSKKAAGHFCIDQKIIEPSAEDWVNHFHQLMYHQEEPLQSSSVLTQLLVYKLAKENNITVLLDGQGADEVLGGYKKYTQWYLQQLFTKDSSQYFKERKLLRQNDFIDSWGWRNYAAAIFPGKTAQVLQQKAITQQNNHPFINRDFLFNFRNADTLQKPVVKQLEDILYYNTFNTGLPELLRYADRNSMAHSREVRLPFLSHELVQFIFSLPAAYKIKDGFTKWILRKAMEPQLPKEIVWRKGKVGFEPPQKEWMQNKQVQEMIIESRRKLVKEKVLQPTVIDAPLQPKAAHDAGNFDWRYLCASTIFNAINARPAEPFGRE
ncbi:MAG: asparagine synthase (glutamine-hydrolyzing) [Panacibacter sp.]